MPIPKSPTPLQAASFTMVANPHAIAGVQANETFMVTANDNQHLGNDGQRVGFAKYQFDEAKFNDITQQLNDLPENGLTRLKNGLQGALDNRDSTPEQIAEKRAALRKEVRKFLPKDERAGVNDLSDRDLITKADVTNAAVEADKKKLGETVHNLNTIVNLAAALHGGAQTPPDRGLLARTVASSQVDQLLGTDCVAEETFGVDAQGRNIGISIQGDGAGITSQFRVKPGDAEKKNCLLQVDLKNSEIQRGLSDLEAVDYITGQIDRHCGNIFIDPETKKVTGIDNDMAFPEISREQLFANGGEFMGKAVTGMPRMMHEETAQKLLAVSPEALRQMLSQMPTPEGVSRLSPAAIDSACDRLAKLQNELKKPDGGTIKVVAQFDEQTYAEAMAEQEAVLQAAYEGKSIKQNLAEDPSRLDGCLKTSYIASATLQAERYNMGMKEQPEKYAPLPVEAPGKAPRETQAAMYARQLERSKQTFVKNPASLGMIGGGQAQAQAMAIHKEIADLKQKIAHYDKEIDGLKQHKMGSMVRSLASGGLGNRKEFYAGKKLHAQQQIGELTRQLEGIAEKAMTTQFKQDLAHDAAIAANNMQQAPAQNQAAPPLVESPKAAKNKIPAKDKQAAPSVHAAEDEQDVTALDELDDLDDNKVDLKQEGLKKSPSVGEMLKRSQSAPALSQGVEGPKPGGNSLRESGKWQSAQPRNPAPKQGGNHLPASRL